ncbi:phospholipid carrier-dependent glycosyltransferase [Synechocystis sp. PCC 7338]|uniref:phospholipid carrier-dependent glycosyltransferase n=1 Tax=Synechocystis sp. PCC 7338 TaxID=2732530 RepID=UPI001BAFD310|nr:phospholipid carrier-dependent glycosyltransferase [Synechocystis sp. PCC 7338]QUS60169.1 phospholipid carrier-dependent glycosyltransferase [Synechocystis sp. PCC 7338]
MVKQILSKSWVVPLLLAMVWLGSNGLDRLWLAIDQTVPAWDQSNHLSYGLEYLQALRSPNLFRGEWWRSFWMLSPKYPPLTYIVNAPFQGLGSPGSDLALLSNWLWSGILILSVYGLGKKLFSREIGLWAVAIMVLIPRLIHSRLIVLLDSPLLAFTLLSFTCLTYWKEAKGLRAQWLWAIAAGVALGLGLLSKQSIIFYLFFPLVGLGLWTLGSKQWQRFAQLLVGLLASIPLWYPWYRTNWIYLFSTAQNSNAIPATLEGDPPINTLAAWTYYWQDLPNALSWVWLIPPLVGVILSLLNRFPASLQIPSWREAKPGLLWLGYYYGGTYLICSAIQNKDDRYILPYLPIVAIFLAFGLTRWCGRWLWVRWGTLAIAILVTLGNLFPIPGSNGIVQVLNPSVLFRPDFVLPAPNMDVITTAIETTPAQRINLGVIPNTPAVNPNTLNYYGAAADFRAYGRELSRNGEIIQQDQQNFDWFLTKTGDNYLADPVQVELGETIAQNADFAAVQAWPLPDGDELSLWHRRQPKVEVKLSQINTELPQLTKVDLPASAPPGQPVPITYHWQGNGDRLSEGIVLLTWENTANPDQVWFHDHAIGLGKLLPTDNGQGVEVIERTAMAPQADLPPGDYRLKGQWLDPSTMTAQPLPLPEITLNLDADAPALPAPPLDFVSQLYHLAQNLRQGITGLEPVFAQVDRINLYDPRHDYLRQGDASWTYRLSQNPVDPLSLTYGQVLARVLQENPPQAIAALQSLVRLDPKNPYAHAYLAFVYLYDWQGYQGEQALKPSLALAPDNAEINGLQAIALFMQGKIWPAWQTVQNSGLLN